MIDQAGILMAQGLGIASERIQGVNDNMSSHITTNIMRSIIWKQGNVFIWWKISFIKWRQGNL